MARGIYKADVNDGRVVGGTVVYNKYTYPKRVEPPALTLEELRAEHERIIAPLLQTPLQST